MAKKDNRYIRFYTPGSAAVKVEIQDEQTWAPLPDPKPAKKIDIPVDPIAIFGFAVAVCMLILMAVGITRLNVVRREVVTLEHYVAQLSAEHVALEETYANLSEDALICARELSFQYPSFISKFNKIFCFLAICRFEHRHF